MSTTNSISNGAVAVNASINTNEKYSNSMKSEFYKYTNLYFNGNVTHYRKYSLFSFVAVFLCCCARKFLKDNDFTEAVEINNRLIGDFLTMTIGFAIISFVYFSFNVNIVASSQVNINDVKEKVKIGIYMYKLEKGLPINNNELPYWDPLLFINYVLLIINTISFIVMLFSDNFLTVSMLSNKSIHIVFVIMFTFYTNYLIFNKIMSHNNGNNFKRWIMFMFCINLSSPHTVEIDYDNVL